MKAYVSNKEKSFLTIQQLNDYHMIVTKKLVELNPYQLKALSGYFHEKEKKTLVEFLPSKFRFNSWFKWVVSCYLNGESSD